MARLFDDASSQYLSNGSPPLTALDCTIAAWFNLDDLSVGPQVIASIGSSTSTDLLALIAAPTAASAPLRATHIDSTGTVTGTANGLATGWASGIATIVGSNPTATAYLNGTTTLAALGLGVTLANLDRIYIGRRANNGVANYFSGSIAEVAVWNIGLAAADRAAFDSGLSALHIKPQNLVFYCEMLGEASPENERIGARSMTLNGTPTASAHPRRVG